MELHNICIDEQNKITVKFHPTDDYAIDYKIRDTLRVGGYDEDGDIYVYNNSDLVKFGKILKWTVTYFVKEFGKENVDLCNAIMDKMDTIKRTDTSFEDAKNAGEMIKNKTEHFPNISDSFKRKLMEYQNESVEHMITLGNAANFSVPGSGKTTITYAAISRWQDDKKVEKILVIGPTASFLPWEEEYQSCFGNSVKSLRITGDISNKFHLFGESFDLFLMHFNTAMNRQHELKQFMQRWKTVLIIDESHNIKSPDLRRWASTALNVAPYATRRIVLSGTPMPNNAKDLWTQITFLWPNNYPLDNQMIYNNYAKKSGIGKYQPVLNSLFCRIKKDDLQLPEPKWDPIPVPLGKVQQDIYDAIAAKTLQEHDALSIHDQGQLQKFRMAKMVRLLQTASNPTLLQEKSLDFGIDKDTFSEEFGFECKIDKLPEISTSLIDQIKNYTEYELPTKIAKAIALAKDLVNKGHKVIIWNSFIHNMYIFENLLREFNPVVINGKVTRDTSESGNRDELIKNFKNKPEFKILIASPASLGESVSLHKNLRGETICNHAIYLDRNFNGAQYMQSMDRIHRIGMNRSVEVNYHLIIAKNTIDEVINRRLNEKWRDMLDALQDDMLQSLEINPESDNMNLKEFNLDYKQTIEYLKKVYQTNESDHS